MNKYLKRISMLSVLVILCVSLFGCGGAEEKARKDEVMEQYISEGGRPISSADELRDGEICMSDEYGRMYAFELDF